MKAVLVFLAIVGLSLGAPRHHSLAQHEKAHVKIVPRLHKIEFAPRSLIDDLMDFINLLPLDDLKKILDDHVESDGALSAVIEYLQGDEWAKLVDEVGSKPAVQDFIKYLTDAGLPVDVLIGLIHDLIQNAKPGVEPDQDGSLRPLLDELEAALPVQELVDLLHDKLQNSPDFQDLYTTISSEKAHSLVEEVRAIDEVQRLAQRLRDYGVQVDETLAIIYEFLGWGKPVVKHSPRSLIDDLMDFINLLPLDDLKKILDDHVERDGALSAVIEYLQGDEWAKLVDEVGSKPAVQDFIKYLTDAGLPVDVLIGLIHDLIQNAKPGVEPDQDGSLRPLLDELEAALPVQELVDLLHDKLQNSPDFQDLYTTISSEKAHSLVEEVRAIDEVQRLAQRLRDYGVQVDETLAIIYEFLGWGKPVVKHSPRSLIDDLMDFINLLPLDDLKKILDDHVESDGALSAVIEYLQGDEWAKLVDEVGSKPAVQDFIKYLTDAGLPVDVLIGLIHDLIQNAKPGVEPDQDGSLRPLLDELEAALPVQELVDLLHDKLQNSPDFQDLYTTISSEKAHSLVEEVRAIDEVQRLAQRLRDYGVQVDETLAIIYEFLGWGKPVVKHSPRSLIDDLMDFINLLPLDDLKKILDDHVESDGALSAVIEYLQGDEWAKLVDEVGSKPAVQDFIKYLTDAGLPVDVLIGLLHDLIQNAKPGVEPDQDGSLRPLLDEVEAALPVQELVDLLHDKLQNSPDFQDLYTTISSEKAHSLVEEVRAIDEVQRLAQRLRDYGVQVDETLAIIYEFLGWGKP